MAARRKIRRSKRKGKTYKHRSNRTLVTATATIRRGKTASMYKKRKTTKRRIKRRGGKRRSSKK